MKKLTIYIVLLCLGCLFISVGTSVATEMHPRNKLITQLYPRPFKLRFPEVPRVTPAAALQYYKTGKAFFVHVGEAGGNVPGGLQLSEAKVQRVNVAKLLNITKGKYIILYCH